ncbi:MAG TPA: hypothetical protein VNX25_06125, partial [Verrucomicrobiae bacterium]|nr:hypothetical protein [Verrucomicrobiae bacterium]
WRLMKWSMQETPRHEPGTVRTPEGEILSFDEHGLLRSKSVEAGDSVRYDAYRCVGGIPLATSLAVTDRYGDSVQIVLRDPEVNTPVEQAAFTPNLEGITVVPWTLFPEQP